MSVAVFEQEKHIERDTIKAMATATLPKTSARSSKWATKNLRDWSVDYNYRNPENECPYDLLSPFRSKEILNKWLCIYVTETRNQDGDAYPPKTIYVLLCGILQEIRVTNSEYPNFLKKEDPDFSTFQFL